MSASIYMGIANPQIGNGDAKDSKATFVLTSFGFSAVAPANQNGQASGKPSVGPITVTVPAVQAPLLLASLLAHQTHTISINIFETGSKNLVTEFQEITLDNAILTLFQETVSDGDNTPMLELSFAYRRLTFTEHLGGTVIYSPGEDFT